jgi:hypothetical protein
LEVRLVVVVVVIIVIVVVVVLVHVDDVADHGYPVVHLGGREAGQCCGAGYSQEGRKNTPIPMLDSGSSLAASGGWGQSCYCSFPASASRLER